MMWRRLVLAALAVLCVAPSLSPGPARGASDELEELMHLMAARRHGEVDFIEQHFLAVLKRPVESSGIMIYDAPARLEKRTKEPRPETLLLEGDVLTVQRAGQTRVLDLKAYPAILPLIESMRATLAGDANALEREFTVEYAGSLSRWMLTLSPRDAQVLRKISKVRIEGVRDNLVKVEILQTDGDRSLMTLRDHPIT
jgi:Outer membrane lipoprotein carrier protein LolA-like